MKTIKQKDILNSLEPYTVQFVTPVQGQKVFKMDDFVKGCIKAYAKQIKAVNIKYIVEYKN